MPADSSAQSVEAGTAAQTPLSPEQLAQLEAARQRRRAIDRAANVSAFHAWSAVVLAVCAAPFAWLSTTAMVVALGLAVVAVIEFRGRSLLRRLDPRGPRVLAANQLLLLAIILSYCAWRLYTIFAHPEQYTQYTQTLANDPQLAHLADSIEQLVVWLAVAIYGSVALVSILYQGAMTAYYLTRGRHVQAYREQTPEWVRELMARVG